MHITGVDEVLDLRVTIVGCQPVLQRLEIGRLSREYLLPSLPPQIAHRKEG